MLTDRTWKLKYTPDDGNLVQLFYVPALQDASRRVATGSRCTWKAS